jgi:hypothetical protein
VKPEHFSEDPIHMLKRGGGIIGRTDPFASLQKYNFILIFNLLVHYFGVTAVIEPAT